MRLVRSAHAVGAACANRARHALRDGVSPAPYEASGTRVSASGPVCLANWIDKGPWRFTPLLHLASRRTSDGERVGEQVAPVRKGSSPSAQVRPMSGASGAIIIGWGFSLWYTRFAKQTGPAATVQSTASSPEPSPAGRRCPLGRLRVTWPDGWHRAHHRRGPMVDLGAER